MQKLGFLLLLLFPLVWADVAPEKKLPALHKAIIAGDMDAVKELIANGADVNELDRKMGNAPLHIAAQGDYPQIAKLLIESGAFVNLQTPRAGFSPLMIAVWYSKPQNIKELLKASDINIYLKTPQGVTAEQWVGGWDKDIDANEAKIIAEIKGIFAVYKKKQQQNIAAQKIMVVLLDKQLSVAAKAQQVKQLISKGYDVNTVQPVIGNGNDTHTPLLVAARSGYSEIVKMLLVAGADQTKTGYMMNAVAFHKACYMGHPEVLKLLVKDKNAHKVIDDQGPNNGYTPLHDAIWHGHTAAAKVLIEAGARTDLKTYEGDTPLDLAKRYKYTEIVKLLEK
ncbi:ankyrin repeat domain-containing protein [Candidatus Uabimicrobium amorphum]|uniref:UNC-44 ankyrin n=1 Tax=Uabimicrobium amorphum TaxID=2596890 RepID=A0A5S9ISS8_UABAM|nr:ankyrin repeat domain-containing protein [Candidatus Uabimicrobium amorphum]BBM87264.1 UNC-44 ankyrin [Candidatus Uabimicrobium amorphum]